MSRQDDPSADNSLNLAAQVRADRIRALADEFQDLARKFPDLRFAAATLNDWEHDAVKARWPLLRDGDGNDHHGLTEAHWRDCLGIERMQWLGLIRPVWLRFADKLWHCIYFAPTQTAATDPEACRRHEGAIFEFERLAIRAAAEYLMADPPSHDNDDDWQLNDDLSHRWLELVCEHDTEPLPENSFRTLRVKVDLSSASARTIERLEESRFEAQRTASATAEKIFAYRESRSDLSPHRDFFRVLCQQRDGLELALKTDKANPDLQRRITAFHRGVVAERFPTGMMLTLYGDYAEYLEPAYHRALAYAKSKPYADRLLAKVDRAYTVHKALMYEVKQRVEANPPRYACTDLFWGEHREALVELETEVLSEPAPTVDAASPNDKPKQPRSTEFGSTEPERFIVPEWIKQAEANEGLNAAVTAGSQNQRTGETQVGNEADAMRRLLTLFSGGVVDERFESAKDVLENSALTVQQKLVALDRAMPIPSIASAEQLAKTIGGVTKQAVMKTDWWKMNRRGQKNEDIDRRGQVHRDRAGRQEQRASDEYDRR